jgi:hypothetical protein
MGFPNPGPRDEEQLGDVQEATDCCRDGGHRTDVFCQVSSVHQPVGRGLSGPLCCFAH